MIRVLPLVPLEPLLSLFLPDNMTMVKQATLKIKFSDKVSVKIIFQMYLICQDQMVICFNYKMFEFKLCTATNSAILLQTTDHIIHQDCSEGTKFAHFLLMGYPGHYWIEEMFVQLFEGSECDVNALI